MVQFDSWLKVNILLKVIMIRSWVILSVKSYLISGLVDKHRIQTSIFAISPNHAIKVFQKKYPEAEDIFVIQNLFKRG